jgi:hypothetical protein
VPRKVPTATMRPLLWARSWTELTP